MHEVELRHAGLREEDLLRVRDLTSWPATSIVVWSAIVLTGWRACQAKSQSASQPRCWSWLTASSRAHGAGGRGGAAGRAGCQRAASPGVAARRARQRGRVRVRPYARSAPPARWSPAWAAWIADSLIGTLLSEVATTRAAGGRALPRRRRLAIASTCSSCGSSTCSSCWRRRRSRRSRRRVPRSAPRSRADRSRRLTTRVTSSVREGLERTSLLCGSGPSSDSSSVGLVSRCIEQQLRHVEVHAGAHDDPQHAEVLAVLREACRRAPASRAGADARRRRTPCSW